MRNFHYKTYPRVLRKPQTLPSAYNDTTSPSDRMLAEPIFESAILAYNFVDILLTI